jgi:hypothetical protein
LWRKYESRSGRWTSPDPYSGSISIANPQSFNRYAHVGNDPVNLVDPTGLFCIYWETVENTAKMMTITAHEECFLEGGGGDGGGGGVDLSGGGGGQAEAAVAVVAAVKGRRDLLCPSRTKPTTLRKLSMTSKNSKNHWKRQRSSISKHGWTMNRV